MIPLLLAALALATPGFDPTAPAAVFTGPEVDDAAGQPLWSAIERLEDPDRALFGPGDYNTATAWPADAAWAPHIGDCFQTERPDTGAVLLHVALHAADASGTPILLVPGAGDNATRAFHALAPYLDATGRPVYALTFGQSHGDVLAHAELIADAIARIRARTGEPQVDVVAHSMGGVSLAVYLSHTAQTTWDHPAYDAAGTPFRDDVRRAVFVATPFGGLDTVFRWSAGNLTGLDAATALAPTSWRTHYPWGTTSPAVFTDLSSQDLHPDGGDLFPGHRQVAARQPHPLPGSLPWLGAYALQPDWWTTYEGGVGYQSVSAGIEATVADGGDLIATLPHRGVAPAVEIFVLAGDSPLLPSDPDAPFADLLDGAWSDLAAASAATWTELVGEATTAGLLDVTLSPAEAAALARGELVLGEITGPSDGIVFVSSATATEALTGRGAVVTETHLVALSHLDLLAASTAAGQALIAASTAEPSDAWLADVGHRYVAADTLGWMAAVLADGEGPDADPTDDAPVDPEDPGLGHLSCRTLPSSSPPWALLMALSALVLWRREAPRHIRARLPPGAHHDSLP